MLSLDDDRWKQLTTFFGEPADIPNILQSWLDSVGSDQEYTVYGDDLFQMFLHQVTITNAAFAIVPWLVDVCKKDETNFQVEYLIDVALVEANRISYGVYGNREGTEAYSAWLMADYTWAIIEARDLVEDVIDAGHDVELLDRLIAIKPALYGNADLAWAQW